MNKLFQAALARVGKLFPKENSPAPETGKKDTVNLVAILNGLGGRQNIEDFTTCSTRLRVKVSDLSKVSPNRLKNETGAAAVNTKDDEVQIVYGTTLLPKIMEKVEEEIKDIDSKNAENFGQKVSVTSPLAGQGKELSQVSDPVFASGALGQGMAIIPSEGEIYAPAKGKITALFPTGHAFVLTTEDNVELFIHIGINTASIQAEEGVFEKHVTEGKSLEAGDKIITADLEKLESLGYETDTIILVANSFDFRQGRVVAGDHIEVGSKIFEMTY